ncbi:RNA 2',3'-cyclic phosphodiesterase [Geomonas sp.]|uniref:RNA 2',3'-cyclic phosphodiesterase n=1 Tax=Geomonas sp. TaxID=2651584 RepID=UPI002B47A08B|nr:RNA 2',3'-cyclic phosphodiesterase [Geomonas sp.]HJV36809.1 RNA 2',3'-cyclic phosphodiesterase [Geomonas sp.]
MTNTSPPQLIRLFVAIDLPDPVKAPLHGLSRELPHASWVKLEQLHLTLRFIGEVSKQTLSAIADALQRVRFARFPLTLCGVGHFPPRSHPRVLWVGMEGCGPLIALQQEVELALIDAGIPPEERPFSPHITLARLKETAPSAVLQFEKSHAALSCPTFEVGEFILYSSVLTRQGAIHTREAVYPCTG